MHANERRGRGRRGRGGRGEHLGVGAVMFASLVVVDEDVGAGGGGDSDAHALVVLVRVGGGRCRGRGRDGRELIGRLLAVRVVARVLLLGLRVELIADVVQPAVHVTRWRGCCCR